jgi:hypothetical protein
VYLTWRFHAAQVEPAGHAALAGPVMEPMYLSSRCHRCRRTDVIRDRMAQPKGWTIESRE